MEGETYIYIVYNFYICFGIPKKTCLSLMNRLNSLKHLHHFYAHNANQKAEKEKRKKKISSVQLFVTHAILRNLLSKHEDNLRTYDMIITKKSPFLYFVIIVIDKM